MKDLFGNDNQKMLALSWKQPFGSAMLFGKIETRVWSTAYRGLVLICTSKQAYDENTVERICGENFIDMCLELAKESDTLDLNGYAIAVGKLVHCRPMNPVDELKAYVKYRPDLYSHIYEDVRKIKPFPWKGCQGWKKVEQNIIDQIEFI